MVHNEGLVIAPGGGKAQGSVGATAARVVAHLRTGRVRARDGYPAGRIWALVLHACSGAPPYYPRSATHAVFL